MTLVRWSPMNSGWAMRNRWSKMMNEMFGDVLDDEMVERAWMPHMDIVEGENEVRVVADLPGMKKDDVDITVENGVLTISGERKMEEERKDEDVHHSERIYGKFSRRFQLHDNVKVDKIEATFKDGVLTIRLPKAEESKPRKIQIHAA